jgi:hypothetical protein
MWLSDSYDVPQELIDNPPSPAFRRFLLYWFGSNSISTDERLRAIDELTPEELPIAQQLVRRNLKTRHNKLINATWLLGDTSAAPLLRMMLEEEPDESRRLTIAGALWKLVRDPVFVKCLEQAKRSGLIAVYGHLHQVLWLDDERALNFLVELLPEEDEDKRKATLIRIRRFLWHTPFRRMAHQAIKRHSEAQGAGPWALSLLNSLESGVNLAPDKQNPPSYYRRRLQEPGFCEHMLEIIRAGNEARRYVSF